MLRKPARRKDGTKKVVDQPSTSKEDEGYGIRFGRNLFKKRFARYTVAGRMIISLTMRME